MIIPQRLGLAQITMKNEDLKQDGSEYNLAFTISPIFN